MSGRTCRSPSLAWTRRPAPQPSTPGWAVPERAANAKALKARFATVVRMPPPFGRRTTKKESRRSPRPAVALDERIEEIMDRVQQAGDNQVERVAAPEEYLYPGARPRRRDVVRCRGLERGPCRQLSRAGPGRRRGPRDQRRDPQWPRRGRRDAVRASREADALGIRAPGQAPVAAGSRRLPRTTSGSMCRLASGTATSATTPQPWNG